MSTRVLLLLSLLLCGLEPGEGIPTNSLDEDTFSWIETNPEWTPSGQKIIEGDIVLENDDPRLTSRKFKVDPESRWPDAPHTGWPLVRYTLKDYPSADYGAIYDGLNHWMENTCITFRETTNFDQPHLQFIEGNGCYSAVGRSYNKSGQHISIGNGCKSMTTVAHEVGHAIGFFHEHCRSDRDDYVTIMFDNIVPAQQHNFNKHVDNSTGVEYDYTSLMHYGSKFCNINGSTTIMPKHDPTMERFMGHHKDGLSFRDKLLANRVYDCIGKWKRACGADSVECENLGYMGADCKCVCPPGTSGHQCQHVKGDYYPALTCGGIMTAPGYIETSNWPDIFNPDEWCQWWVQAGEGERVRVTFHAFDLTFRNPSGHCTQDKLELRLEDPLLNGNVYCEHEIVPDDEFVSEGSEMFISFWGGHSNKRTGFSATIDFI